MHGQLLTKSCLSASVCLGARSKSGQKQRGAVRGANNGKLLPGEKKRLKREKMNAKRAARSAAHGFDLESINAELVQFVAADDDMKVHPATLHAAVETDMVSQLQLYCLAACCCRLQSTRSSRPATFFIAHHFVGTKLSL